MPLGSFYNVILCLLLQEVVSQQTEVEKGLQDHLSNTSETKEQVQ